VVRIEIMERRLDTVLRAIHIVQPALQKFYGSLTDERKSVSIASRRRRDDSLSLRMAGASAQEKIDKPTGKFLRPRSDTAP
jgi:hypothetical protein